MLRKRIMAYLKKQPEYRYRLVIGTDSQVKNSHITDFVTAIIIHRVGAGGIYFWKRVIEQKQYVLKQRMYQEAIYSLVAADEFLNLFKNDGIGKIDLEIHVDIGKVGQTREVISEIVGMIRSSGFVVKTKPDAFAASKVADRHT
jgi:predicted RNase H-related nuclease YkuK (DUF458 family)